MYQAVSAQSDERIATEICQHSCASEKANYCSHCGIMLFPACKTQCVPFLQGELSTILSSDTEQRHTAFFTQGNIAFQGGYAPFGLYALAETSGEEASRQERLALHLLVQSILHPLTQNRVQGDIPSFLTASLGMVDMCLATDEKQRLCSTMTLNLVLLLTTSAYIAFADTCHTYLWRNSIIESVENASLGASFSSYENASYTDETSVLSLGHPQMPPNIHLVCLELLYEDALLLCPAEQGEVTLSKSALAVSLHIRRRNTFSTLFP